MPFTTILMLRHCFRKPPFCLWRGKTREYRTARQICVARVPGWISTTRHSLIKNKCLEDSCLVIRLHLGYVWKSFDTFTRIQFTCFHSVFQHSPFLSDCVSCQSLSLKDKKPMHRWILYIRVNDQKSARHCV